MLPAQPLFRVAVGNKAFLRVLREMLEPVVDPKAYGILFQLAGPNPRELRRVIVNVERRWRRVIADLKDAGMVIACRCSCLPQYSLSSGRSRRAKPGCAPRSRAQILWSAAHARPAPGAPLPARASASPVNMGVGVVADFKAVFREVVQLAAYSGCPKMLASYMIKKVAAWPKSGCSAANCSKMPTAQSGSITVWPSCSM